MQEQDLAYIERYYRNSLDPAELAEFQRRLETDAVFREAVELHRDALEAIRLEGTAMLRARLEAKGRDLDAKAPVLNRFWILPAVLLCILGIWLIIRAPARCNRTTPPPAQKAASKAPVETPPAAPLRKKAGEEPAPKNETGQQLFAVWFKPYRDESLEPARRGASPASPSEQFQQFYWDGNYGAALRAFDALDAGTQNNDNLLFLKANCLLASERDIEANTLLEAIVRNGSSRFRAQAPWYLALARLRAGRRQEAKSLLRAIAADVSSPRRADAQKLLQIMN